VLTLRGAGCAFGRHGGVFGAETEPDDTIFVGVFFWNLGRGISTMSPGS
jgi:hypothetical protein